MLFSEIVRETTSSTGTGALTLNGAVAGYFPFSSDFAVGAPILYGIRNGTQVEVGIGHLSSSNVFVRDVVDRSSNANTFVNFSAGATVYCTMGARLLRQLTMTRHEFNAVEFDLPNGADFPITAPALIIPDSTNAGRYMAQFAEGTEEAVTFERYIPPGCTMMFVRATHYAQSAPGGAVTVQATLRARYSIDNALESSWTSEFDLTAWSLAMSNVNRNVDTQVISLASLGVVADSDAQFLLSRQGADTDDTLTGAWNLRKLVLGFA